MRRGIRIYVLCLVVIGLMLGVSVSPSVAAVKAVIDTTWTAWPSTIYYLSRLSGPDEPYDDITVYITAVDEYTLYVNGELIGSDNDWRSVEEYTVNISGSDINLGVQVNNSGTGLGNGLMIDIKAGADWLGTTTMKRRSAVVAGSRNLYPENPSPSLWYHYAGDIVEFLGEDWYTLNYDSKKATTILNDTNITSQLGQPILAVNEKGETFMVGVDYLPDPHIEVITGFPGNIDLGSSEGGGIQLRRIEGENIALGKPAEEDKLTDGDPTLAFYGYNQDPLGTHKYVDLERIYRVNRMVLYTGGGNPNEWERKAVRGYAVDISNDKFRWEEVGVIHEIGITNKDEGGYDYAIVDFPDEWARYARFRITEPRIDFPSVGEIMIYGIGYAYEGQYDSDWVDFGTPNTQKNFDVLSWEGNIPDGTDIKIQTKTAYMNAEGALIESPWSLEYSGRSFPLESPEPASMIKYRVKMRTQDIYKTPVLKSFTFRYSEEDQPVATAEGYIVPNTVPMGIDTTFVYPLSYELYRNQDLKYITLSVPSYASLNHIYSTDSGDTLTVANNRLVDIIQTTPDSLYIEFTNAIRDSDNSGPDSLYISFNTKLLGNIHNFSAWMYNEGMNDNAGGIKVWENRDLGSWTVMTTSIIKGIISDVKAVPKVFTPNNDGINDFTVIEFVVTKINPDLKVQIFDTKGGLVTTIWDKKVEMGEWFVKEKRGNADAAKKMPGYWDGTDEDGDLVPPGVYLYQVIAETDEGDKVESGSVVVGY